MRRVRRVPSTISDGTPRPLRVRTDARVTAHVWAPTSTPRRLMRPAPAPAPSPQDRLNFRAALGYISERQGGNRVLFVYKTGSEPANVIFAHRKILHDRQRRPSAPGEARPGRYKVLSANTSRYEGLSSRPHGTLGTSERRIVSLTIRRSAMYFCRDHLGRRRRVFVLPYTNHAPPCFRQKPIRFSVTLSVSSDLLGPVLGVGGRLRVVLGAAVPETTVHENRHLGPREDDVGGSTNAGQRADGDAVPEAQRVDGSPEGELGLGIPAAVGLHALAGAITGRASRPLDCHATYGSEIRLC